MSNSSFYVDPNAALTVAAAGTPDYTGVSLHTSTQAAPIPIMWGTRRVSPNVLWQSDIVFYPTPPPTVTIYQTVTYPPATGLLVNVTDAGGGGGGGFPGPTDPSIFSPAAQFMGSILVTHSGGGTSSYGATDPNNSDCRWWVPMIFGLCEGPIDDVLAVWDGNGGASVPWSQIGREGAGRHTIGLFYTIFPGSSTQNPWAFWSSSTVTGNTPPGGSTPPLYPGQDLAYRGTCGVEAPLVTREGES